MAATCTFCHRLIKLDESYFRSESREFCHTACLMAKLNDLRRRGVNEEVIQTIQEAFDPKKKKKEKKPKGGFSLFG